jgi:hypothetical protein
MAEDVFGKAMKNARSFRGAMLLGKNQTKDTALHEFDTDFVEVVGAAMLSFRLVWLHLLHMATNTSGFVAGLHQLTVVLDSEAVSMAARGLVG